VRPKPTTAKEETMVTGKKPAHEASKELRDKKTKAKEKTVAGSDLAQAPRKSKPEASQGRGKKKKDSGDTGTNSDGPRKAKK